MLQLHDKIDSLQSQVGTLLRTLSADPNTQSVLSQSPLLCENSGSGHVASSTPSSKEPAYIGPTSFAFGLDLRGEHPQPAFLKSDTWNVESSGNPFNLGKEHAYRMIKLFEETVGDVYPCIDFDTVKSCASNLFDKLPETVYNRLFQAVSPLSTFDRDFEILRAILANGLVIEGDGQSECGAMLMSRIEDTMYNRIKVFEVDTKELLLLLLMAWQPQVRAVPPLTVLIEPLLLPAR